jgi:DNA-binding GntR family transcriptional regulator
MTSKKTTKISFQDRVLSDLRNSIILGKYLPGEHLVEEDLARTFNSSRSTIRLCLSVLERDGLVTEGKPRGFFVSKVNLQETLELLEARTRIETLAASLAAKKIDSDSLNKLSEILAQMELSIEERDYMRYSSLNSEFHSVIYEASGNKSLEYVGVQLKTRIIRLQYKIAFIQGRPRRSLQEHREIYEALKNRDEPLVERLIRKHINGIKHAIEKNYGLLEA